MPPCYAHILQTKFSSEALTLAGWYFTLPTVAAAIANPLWGRLADRIGIRAEAIATLANGKHSLYLDLCSVLRNCLQS